MGCAVNGPGEAGDADFGIAGGRDVGFIYAHGRVLKKVSSDILVDELFHEIDAGSQRDAAPEAAEDGQAGRAGHGRSVPRSRSTSLVIARASKLFLPTLRDAPADAEAASHKLLVRGGFIRQVGAGLLTFLPLGWRVHQKVVQVIREEIDAIGGQEMLCPVLTPAELWEATGRISLPILFRLQDSGGRRLRPADVARGDDDLPRARAEVVQAAPAALVPLLDEGARRAARARRPPPSPRVHHEGLVLVRPDDGGARRELRAARRGVRAHLRALRRRGVPRRGGVRDHGRQGVVRLPRPDGIRRERAHALRERRLLRRHRGGAWRAPCARASRSGSTRRKRSRRRA